jgi:hypothetical protein
MTERVVNNAQKRVASHTRKPVNRSSTHIRIKKSTKIALERWMKKHHCKTYSQAIKKLLESSGAGA